MGCFFEYDPVNNILFRYCWECALTDEALLKGDAHGRRLLAARPSCSGIQEFSKVTTADASSDTVRRIALRSPAYGVGQPVVFVAPKDVIYGLSRMFVTVGEESRSKAFVVRTMEQAYKLLGVELPQCSPVDDLG